MSSLEETKPKPLRKYIVFAYKELNLSLFISGCLLGVGRWEAGKGWGVGGIYRMQQTVQRTQLLKIKINAGEGVEKREPSYTVGENAN